MVFSSFLKGGMEERMRKIVSEEQAHAPRPAQGAHRQSSISFTRGLPKLSAKRLVYLLKFISDDDDAAAAVTAGAKIV
jgi:hypothetical protein